MAFGGVAVIKQVSDRCVRITGLTLAAGASGTLSLAAGAGDQKFPASIKWGAYDGIGGTDVTMQDAVQIAIGHTADVATAIAYTVTKTGTVAADFLITLKNATATAGPATEIYVYFH